MQHDSQTHHYIQLDTSNFICHFIPQVGQKIVPNAHFQVGTRKHSSLTPRDKFANRCTINLGVKISTVKAFVGKQSTAQALKPTMYRKTQKWFRKCATPQILLRCVNTGTTMVSLHSSKDQIVPYTTPFRISQTFVHNFRCFFTNNLPLEPSKAIISLFEKIYMNSFN